MHLCCMYSYMYRYLFVCNMYIFIHSPTKADFIRAKYQFLAFTKKYKDEDIGTITDLSKVQDSSYYR